MAHDTRTLGLCVKLSKERPGRPDNERVIYTTDHSVDLLHPEPWNIDQEVKSQGSRYAFSLVIDVRRDTHEFYPNSPRSYIRFDVSGQASVVPSPPDETDKWVSNTCWLDELTQHAGAWLRINTSIPGTFIDLNVQFSP
ncbi:hypothetical protein [Bosea sp. (in: a-proteobacteria)]|jgi:hypothetical protein|uniref:hypothetical protein n=1 Tax=Bosea sp. (in: a-proteobacteria) TaxID=1871050 RepID=UPI002DDCEC73|nr:hypothetical protein [Bosea sp. (in: a-proteobacteria)]